jgi:GDPmannose 4,6-dehydratase
MWRMLQQPTPTDYVIATGETHGLDEFVEKAFSEVGLDWREHVEIDAKLIRPADIAAGRADPSRAERELGWKATLRFADVVREMVRAERLEASNPAHRNAM